MDDSAARIQRGPKSIQIPATFAKMSIRVVARDFSEPGGWAPASSHSTINLAACWTSFAKIPSASYRPAASQPVPSRTPRRAGDHASCRDLHFGVLSTSVSQLGLVEGSLGCANVGVTDVQKKRNSEASRQRERRHSQPTAAAVDTSAVESVVEWLQHPGQMDSGWRRLGAVKVVTVSQRRTQKRSSCFLLHSLVLCRMTHKPCSALQH